MWRGERSSLLPLGHRRDQGWDADLGCRSFRNTLMSSSPLTFTDLDFWDNRSLFKDQKSLAWSSTGLNHRSKISTSSLGSQKHRGTLDMQRWSSASRLAPEGASRPQCCTEFKLKAALEESSMRRAELVQRLQETKDTQLQQSHNISHFMESKHKQLSEAVSVLEQDKEAADQSRFEESRRRAELQDKVLQLELDILKMRSNLERRTPSPNPLSNTLPVTKDEIFREGQKQTEKEMKKLREALRKAEETADDLDYDKNDALRQLQSYKEGKQEAMNQIEELNQRLNRSKQAQAKLEDKLKKFRSHLEQMELERDLLSIKTQRLEDSQNDVKAKLSGALMDKDRLIQEKAELHEKVQTLELQLQREQRGKQSVNEQVCELHTELSQAKTKVNRQKKDTIFMKEELLSMKELNEKLSSDLSKATERLQVTLNQLHELEADKLIQTNQITALETERLKLIEEEEELRKNMNNGRSQDEIRELKDRCCQNMELQDNLKQENQNLQVKCQVLEKKMQIMEAEYNLKKEELQDAGAGFEQEREELRKVAAHWNERWLDVSMTLCSTQAELEEVKKQQHQEKDELTDAGKMTEHAENLRKELKKCQGEIQCLLDEKTILEAELSNIKVSPEELEVKEELRKVWDTMKIRDSELENQQFVRGQVSQQNSEMKRLKQLLVERDEKLREKEQDLKNLEIQRETEKAETQMKISSLEHKQLLRNKDLHLEEKVVRDKHTHEDYEALKALLEEYCRTAEELKQERDHALQQLQDQFQQGKAENKSPPETKKQKLVGLDLIDPNEQRRLVTEQLKSLFREREQHGERSPVFPGKPGSSENSIKNSKSIKRPLVVPWSSPDPSLKTPALYSQNMVKEQDVKQGAVKESSSKTRGSKTPEREEFKQKNTQANNKDD